MQLLSALARRRERDPAPRGRRTRLPGAPVAAHLGARGVLRCPAVVKPAAMLASAGPRPPVDHARPVLPRAAVGRGSLGRLSAGSALGLVLGAAQLVRSVGLWIYAVAALALVVAFASRRRARRRIAALGAVALALGLLVPLPWYVYLQVEYGDPLFGGRPEISQGAPASDAVPAHPGVGGHRAPLRLGHRCRSSRRRVSRVDHPSLPGRA